MADQPAPAPKKVDVTIARLRLVLADVASREVAQRGQRQTFLDQREKLITFSLYGDSTMDSVLGMLADVEEKVAHCDSTLQALSNIRRRAESELESLELTKGVEEAKALLQQLQARQAEDGGSAAPLPREEIQAEISRLQLMIHEASERAAKSIEQGARRD